MVSYRSLNGALFSPSDAYACSALMNMSRTVVSVMIPDVSVCQSMDAMSFAVGSTDVTRADLFLCMCA